MKYTDTSASITRQINITDGPVHGRRFRADHIAITYYLTNTGRWEVASPWGIDITGTVLRRDGSDSQTRKPESVSRYNEPVRFEGEWEWVGQLIDAARPEGNVTLPSLIKQAL